MEPTVLAGPVEFSPADIALIVAVLAAIFIALTAPGWAVLSFATYRRRKAHNPGPASWWAVLGAAAGIVVCAAVAALTGPVLQSVGFAGGVVGVLAGWVSCWAIAFWLAPASTFRPSVSAAPEAPASPAQPTSEGWGR
jgi:hypothetical protein